MTGDQGQGQGQGAGRAAAEHIFVNLIQAVSANNVLLASLTTEIKALREELFGNEGFKADMHDLINNTSNLGEDVGGLTGGLHMALEILKRAAEAGGKGRVTWGDINSIFTEIELESQQEEAEEEEQEQEQQ